jgi:Tfp pilus assembly protein PilF
VSSAAVQMKHIEPSLSPTLALFASPGKRNLVLSLLLVVFTLLLYNRANQLAFTNYDDHQYVSENPHVRAGLTWATVKWSVTAIEQANWHPLTWMSHALDCQLFHLNPAGHHFTSVLLHALNAVLLFLLLAWSTRRTGASFLVAALFAVHPLNVESVAWVAERKNVLSTLFFFLTLAAYGWYALKPGWKRYLAVVGLLACGLAAKPMLVTAPFVLLLLDYWPLGRIQKWSAPSDTLAIEQSPMLRLIVEKLPLLSLIAASSAITLRAQRTGGALGYLAFPLTTRLKNAVYAYASYLWKVVWPAHLTVFYPYVGRSLALWKVTAAAVFLISISCAVWKLRARGYLLTGWLWFLGTLVPVIGIVQVGSQSMADRYTYVPLIGFFVMVVWVAADLVEEKKGGLALWAIPSICLVALSLVCYRQIGYWRDSLTLWTHALQVTQHNSIAENDMGEALVQLHHVEDAYPFFVRAAKDDPNDPFARLNIGTYLRMHGHEEDAIAQYEIALRLGAEPNLRSVAYANLGTVYFDRGDYAKSRSSYEDALRQNPNQARAWQGLGLLYQKQGKLQEAITYSTRAVELQPTGEGYLQLARALAQSNRHAEAAAALEQALKENPDLINVGAPVQSGKQP